MRPDIVELTAFYSSRDGDCARRLINHQLRQLWPDLTGMRLLGIGYATPFLGLFEEAAAQVALMPATQGGSAWPTPLANRVALGREDELPFADRTFDRLVLAHAFECSPHAHRLMRETWRVLKDGGKMVVIVPNRRGLWCWSERTPFGFGQPFSSGQLERGLKSHLFAVGALHRALFMPPLSCILPRGRRLARRLAVPGERLGLRLLPHFSGVLILEAIKEVCEPAVLASPARRGSRRYVPMAEGVMRRGETGPLILPSSEPDETQLSALLRLPRPFGRSGRSPRSGTASSDRPR